MTVAIVDYGSGNLRSAAKSFERAVDEARLNCPVVVTGDPGAVRRADRIVLPGVGAFRDCRDGLMAVDGMWQVIEEEVAAGKPFLGICVGMQLMATRGLEHGETPGFGWIGGGVDLINPSDPALKIPHMGWNTLELVRPHHLLKDIALGPDGLHAYFVHSYHLRAKDTGDVIATADYAGTITAMVARANMAGTQFHPEKSQRLGLKLITNFLTWQP